MASTIYDTNLDKNSGQLPAADAAVVPGARAAGVPERIADRPRRAATRTIALYARSRRLASALARARHRPRRHGGGACCPTRPAMLEAHYGVPMAGAVLNALNTRLDADVIAFMLRHGEAEGAASPTGNSRPPSRRPCALERKQAAGDRLRRSGIPADRRAHWAPSDYEELPRRGRSGFRLERCRATNGTRSR